MRSTSQALEERFGKLPPVRFIIETGTHSPWVSRSLTSMGHSMVVANARIPPLLTTTEYVEAENCSGSAPRD